MREKIKYIMGTKAFHISMVIIIIVILLFVAGIFILRYQVEGETNMPFILKKIILISSTEGIDNGSGEQRWNYNINQNNDIYIYLEKNEKYQEEEAISSILIDNIQVERTEEKGTVQFYRPNISEDGTTFKNSEENKIETIEYAGDLESDLKTLKIANQGGIVVFRYANDNVGTYSSDDEQINHSELLQKAGITQESLQAKINFDLSIKTEGGKEYKTTLSFDMPIEGVVENGTASKEITDFSEIVFKRTKN